MIEELLKVKIWTAPEITKFFKSLEDLFDEEKCVIVSDVTKELLKRGEKDNVSAAEVILVYATQHYFNVEDNNYKALVYHRLGQLYEHHRENFVKAYTYYNKYTLNNTNNGNNHSTLLRALILRDNFTYSDELEKEFRQSLGEIDLGLKSDRLYENIGRLIVSQKEGKDDEVDQITKRLKGIVKTEFLVFPDLITRKDTIRDTLDVPMKVIRFVETL